MYLENMIDPSPRVIVLKTGQTFCKTRMCTQNMDAPLNLSFSMFCGTGNHGQTINWHTNQEHNIIENMCTKFKVDWNLTSFKIILT